GRDFWLSFFFQAEDGIRDFHVTGVQTCALPIYVIAVFDAYRVQRKSEDVLDYGGVHVVFTREAQTADEYIEKFAHDNRKKYDIRSEERRVGKEGRSRWAREQ